MIPGILAYFTHFVSHPFTVKEAVQYNTERKHKLFRCELIEDSGGHRLELNDIHIVIHPGCKPEYGHRMWIHRPDGEGMGLKAEDLNKILLDWYSKHF